MSESNAFDSLSQWVVNFISHKDIFLKQIKQINKERYECCVVLSPECYSSCKIKYFVLPVLDICIKQEADSFFADAGSFADAKMFVVAFNSKKNIDFLYKNWDYFVSYKSLAFVFVNLDNNTWFALKPYVHSRVSDSLSLKKGLFSMAQAAGWFSFAQ